VAQYEDRRLQSDPGRARGAHAPRASKPASPEASTTDACSADIVRAGALWGYALLVRSLDGDPDTLLRDVGLTREELVDHDDYIPVQAVQTLLEQTATELSCPDFGLRLAKEQDLCVFGALAFAVRNAGDLGGALRIAARHLRFHAPKWTLTIEALDQGDAARVIVQGGDDSDTGAAQAYEHTVGAAFNVVSQLTGGAVRPVGAHFRHGPVSSPAAYRERLGVAPEFRMDANAAILSARDLRSPVKNADPQLLSVIEGYLESHAPEPGQCLDRQVERVLSRLMRLGPATLADVAHVLRLHPRTLQRKLSALGLTFEHLRDEVRRDLAQSYLARETIPIAYVAHLLGYADQSVLTRSCLRWFGKTPLAIRREHGAAAGKRA
jgi:AraC-like DNA-binding protein